MEPDDGLPSDLSEIAAQLSAERPRASALELDRAKLSALGRARREPKSFKPAKGPFMRSRIALVSVLSLGILMSGSGATLALSGQSASGSASQVVEPHVGNSPGNQTLGQNQNGSIPGGTLQTTNGQAPALSRNPAAQTQAQTQVQATRQVASTGSSSTLPLTGLAALPILVIGLSLLIVGFVLNRRTRAERAAR